jgi:tetratricopeptide (TPR) repeat protein
LGDYWLGQGSLTEGQAWCEIVITAFNTYSGAGDDVELAKAHAHRVAGFLANNQGRHVLAVQHVEKAIPIYRRLGKSSDLERGLITLSTASGYSGNFEKAFEAVHESNRLAREAGDKFELAWGLEVLSLLTFEASGHAAVKEADDYMQESIALLQELNHPWRNSRSKMYLSQREFLQGNFETALQYAEEVVAFLQEAGAILLATNYKSGTAHALRKIGRLNEAIPIYRETLVNYQNYGHRGAIAHQLECFAFIAIAQEQGETAVQLLSAASIQRERINSHRTPQEQKEYEDQVASLRAGMDEKIFETLWKNGNAMSIEQAIQLALRIV